MRAMPRNRTRPPGAVPPPPASGGPFGIGAGDEGGTGSREVGGDALGLLDGEDGGDGGESTITTGAEVDADGTAEDVDGTAEEVGVGG